MEVNWQELITAGGFGALLWYFVVKVMPAQDDRHERERMVWVESLAEQSKERDLLIKINSETLAENQRLMGRLERAIDEAQSEKDEN